MGRSRQNASARNWRTSDTALHASTGTSRAWIGSLRQSGPDDDLRVVLRPVFPISVQGQAMVRFETSLGAFTLELDAENAPVSTENFLSYVDEGFFDGLIFHRVIPGFMIQGGGMLPD